MVALACKCLVVAHAPQHRAAFRGRRGDTSHGQYAAHGFVQRPRVPNAGRRPADICIVRAAAVEQLAVILALARQGHVVISATLRRATVFAPVSSICTRRVHFSHDCLARGRLTRRPEEEDLGRLLVVALCRLGLLDVTPILGRAQVAQLVELLGAAAPDAAPGVRAPGGLQAARGVAGRVSAAGRPVLAVFHHHAQRELARGQASDVGPAKQRALDELVVHLLCVAVDVRRYDQIRVLALHVAALLVVLVCPQELREPHHRLYVVPVGHGQARRVHVGRRHREWAGAPVGHRRIRDHQRAVRGPRVGGVLEHRVPLLQVPIRRPGERAVHELVDADLRRVGEVRLHFRRGHGHGVHRGAWHGHGADGGLDARVHAGAHPVDVAEQRCQAKPSQQPGSRTGHHCTGSSAGPGARRSQRRRGRLGAVVYLVHIALDGLGRLHDL
mmetsp:Transcript_16719/g.47572  ORF Transcript_16719/g.47572 Transcript_16719/m.47572 type:complete len:443 (+) Transcript_16719:531-1859(+)